jgi:hypothetical protein
MRTHPLWLILLLSTSISTRASDQSKRDGEALIEKAEDQSNIFTLPDFEMHAMVQIENRGKVLEGSYQFLWNGPEQWREDLSIPGYSETQVGMKGAVYLKRTTDVLQLRIQQLHRALGYGIAGTPSSSFVHMDLLPVEKIKAVRDRKIKGVKLSCVEIEWEKARSGSGREVCVNSSSGIPVRAEPYREETWMPVGGKMFPRDLSYVENGKPVVTIQITEFKLSTTFPPTGFEPPDGSNSRPGCMNPIPAYSLSRPQLTHIEVLHVDRENSPTNELPALPPRLGGQVLVYSLIGTDGVPQRLRVISGDDPSWSDGFLATVKGTKYAPATCNGRAVEVEMIDRFVY